MVTHLSDIDIEKMLRVGTYEITKRFQSHSS